MAHPNTELGRKLSQAYWKALYNTQDDGNVFDAMAAILTENLQHEPPVHVVKQAAPAVVPVTHHDEQFTSNLSIAMRALGTIAFLLLGWLVAGIK